MHVMRCTATAFLVCSVFILGHATGIASHRDSIRVRTIDINRDCAKDTLVTEYRRDRSVVRSLIKWGRLADSTQYCDQRGDTVDSHPKRTSTIVRWAQTDTVRVRYLVVNTGVDTLPDLVANVLIRKSRVDSTQDTTGWHQFTVVYDSSIYYAVIASSGIDSVDTMNVYNVNESGPLPFFGFVMRRGHELVDKATLGSHGMYTVYRINREPEPAIIQPREVTSVAESTQNAHVRMYPNPIRAGESVSIVLGTGDDEADVSITNEQGLQVSRVKLRFQDGKSSLSGSFTSELSAGAYLLTVHQPNGHSWTSSIIVLR
jgi:hypothetical protein